MLVDCLGLDGLAVEMATQVIDKSVGAGADFGEQRLVDQDLPQALTLYQVGVDQVESTKHEMIRVDKVAADLRVLGLKRKQLSKKLFLKRSFDRRASPLM